jgi:hypothetical protein
MSTLNTKSSGLTAEEKKARTKLLREFHQAKLDMLGLPDAVFIPKLQYKPTGKNELYISFFPSELRAKEDIYMEFVNIDYEPETEERNLYKWRWNPHFEEEYEKTEVKGRSTDPRYLIPASELILVTVTKNTLPEAPLSFDLNNPETDLPMDQRTLRDWACVMLNKPLSNKAWLNEIIKAKV